MRIKLSSDLKTATGKVLAAAQEVRKIDAVIQSTHDAEPALREALESAKRLLAAADVEAALGGAATGTDAVDAVRDAGVAIERGGNTQAGLQVKRAQLVTQLKELTGGFETARGSFLQASWLTIEAELKPLFAQIRTTYAQATALDSALGGSYQLEWALAAIRMPSPADILADLLAFEIHESAGPNEPMRHFPAHERDKQAIELTASLSDVASAAAVLRTAA